MPRKHRIIKRRLIAGLVFAAAVAPAAAQARPDFYSVPRAAPSPAGAAHAAPPSAPAVPPVSSGADNGFQWSDAGIGAGGAALLLGAGGAAWAISHRRRRHAAVSG